MRKRNLQPTVLTIRKPYSTVYADNEVEAMLKALDMFSERYPETVHGLNDLAEHGLVLSDGSEITAYVDTEIMKRPLVCVENGDSCFAVNIIITFNYFSGEGCASSEIIRLFTQMFPHFEFNMFSPDTYQVESYHI